MKKYIAELAGTFVLVFLGCGTAMLVGCAPPGSCGYMLTALAFGLAMTVVYYSIGSISGSHLNPAVSFALLMRGSLSWIDFIRYVIAQIVGAFLGSALLFILFFLGSLEDKTKVLAANGTSNVSGNVLAALIIEIILTTIFVTTVLNLTAGTKPRSARGIIIGAALTLVHIIGIGFTGTSVNPARSLGPALVALTAGNTVPITSIWIFIIGPLAGAALAALIHKTLDSKT